METRLRFNICNLETSFVQNQDVPDLVKRMNDNMPPELEYACMYWSQPLVETMTDNALLEAVSVFAYHRLLFWLEVMSLTKKPRSRTDAVHALSRVASWTVSSY